MAQTNRVRRQVVMTLNPATVDTLKRLSDRWGLSRSKLVDLAVTALAREVEGGAPLPIRDLASLLGEFGDATKAERDSHTS